MKYFSGDVSGVIAESLFVYIASRCCHIDINSIIHLRPEKSRYLTPDFVVEGKNNVRNLLNCMCCLPEVLDWSLLFVECKGFASNINPDRIWRGLGQLVEVLNHDYIGMLFIVWNRGGQGYATYTISIIYHNSKVEHVELRDALLSHERERL